MGTQPTKGYTVNSGLASFTLKCWDNNNSADTSWVNKLSLMLILRFSLDDRPRLQDCYFFGFWVANARGLAGQVKVPFF
jgi:hypothetical protein